MTLTVWGVLVRHFADCPSVRICLMFLLMIGLGLWVLERKTTEINHQATLIFYPHIVTSLSQDGCCCHSRIRITSKDGRKQKEGEKSQICPPLFFFFFFNEESHSFPETGSEGRGQDVLTWLRPWLRLSTLPWEWTQSFISMEGCAPIESRQATDSVSPKYLVCMRLYCTRCYEEQKHIRGGAFSQTFQKLCTVVRSPLSVGNMFQDSPLDAWNHG